MSNDKKTTFDIWIAWLKNRSFVATLLVVAAIVIGIGSITGAMDNTISFFQKYFADQQNPDKNSNNAEELKCSEIAIVTYDGQFEGERNVDSKEISLFLSKNAYNISPLHQWELEKQPPDFFSSFDLLILSADFALGYDLSNLILSGVPVVVLNRGYVDDFSLGEYVLPEDTAVNHFRSSEFRVANNAHKITGDLLEGSLNIGGPIWTDAIDTSESNVDLLVTGGSDDKAVLAASIDGPYVWFGWYRLSQAFSGSVVFSLLRRSLNWACEVQA